MQTRSSTPGQTKRMTNVITKVMAIAILATNGREALSIASVRHDDAMLERLREGATE
jgi:hypothetical protein